MAGNVSEWTQDSYHHDAGKFAGGGYHKGERPEEEWSVDALLELAQTHAVEKALVDEVADSIRQLYRDDPEPLPLARVLFDADNLDKLGPLGVANYFVKLGLRGGAVSEKALYRLTVELTYARHAPRCLMTKTGRRLAAERAPETERFLTDLLEHLRESGLYDFRIEEIAHDGLPLVVAAPPACGCGGDLDRRVWEAAGMKCSEIHLEHSCRSCGFKNAIRFCRPRLPT